MAIKTSIFSPKGISRDLTRSKFSPDLLYDAYNIRFTARGSNKTLLSITNEKGTKKTEFTGDSIEGTYLGHCVINSYLTLFTKGTADNIYRLNFNTNVCTRLYSGSLNFNLDNPIETKGIYEKSDVIKVYWIDGINQPRLINIMGDYSKKTNNPFDFVQSAEPTYVSISRDTNSNGIFQSGTIQYACTYLSLYGQETAPFYLSDVLYTSYSDRGGTPEKSVNCQFTINISFPDINFDYVRIYSIQRTSQNGTPTIKRVIEIPITNNGSNLGKDILYVDTGNTGEAVSQSYLQYLGGDSITAGAFAIKDNTMFFGNITLNEKSFTDEVKAKIKAGTTFGFTLKSTSYPKPTSSTYSYSNTLSSGANCTFKGGETYRTGLVFKHSTGKWSEVYYLGDYVNDYYPSTSDSEISLPAGFCNISKELASYMEGLGYTEVMPVCVFPDVSNRTVIAQGVVNPTIFDVNKRYLNEPFAQASPFFRPMPVNQTSVRSLTSVDGTIYGGPSAFEFRHLERIPGLNDKVTSAELSFSEGVNIYTGTHMLPGGGKGTSMYVDSSICTLNSPEFEFDSDVQNLNLNNCKLRIIGWIPIQSTTSYADIQTSSSPYYTDAQGFHMRDYTAINENGFCGMISSPIYNDAFTVDRGRTQSDIASQGLFDFMVSPWQRSGSINNFGSTDSTISVKPCNLKYHKMSLLRFSNNTGYFDKAAFWSSSISDIKVFNSDTVSMLKLKERTGTDEGDMVYYGNVNTVLLSSGKYYTYIDDGGKISDYRGTSDIVGNIAEPVLTGDRQSNQPISMKYKSVPHAVFALNTDNGYQPILPAISSSDGSNTPFKYPFGYVINDYTPYWNNRSSSKGGYGMKYCKYYVPANYDFPPALNGDYVIKNNGTADELWCYAPILTGGTSNWVKQSFVESMYYSCNSTLGNASYTGSKLFVYESGTLKSITKTTTLQAQQSVINSDTIIKGRRGFLWIAELYNDSVSNRFGGTSDEALANNKWVSAGRSKFLGDIVSGTVRDLKDSSTGVYFSRGDTYYQRYDCLKTYPFTLEDENSVVDILSFMCETHINIDGRYDRNRGQTNNLVMTPTNFNLINHAYTQNNNYIGYNYLEQLYSKVDKFPSTITITEEKQSGSKRDVWSNITMASTIDMDGDKGKIVSLNRFNNDIYCFQETGLSNILFNSRVQIPASDGTPIQITNGLKLQGKIYLSDKVGCINKWSIVETPDGLYFIDNITNSLYRFDGKLSSLSDSLGMRTWVNEINSLDSWNPQVDKMTNFRGFYDKNNNDLYWVNGKYCLGYSELLGQFTGFYSYEGTPAMFNVNDDFYSFYNDGIWKLWDGDYNWFYGVGKPYWITYIDNSMPLYDKIFDNLNFRLEAYSSDNPEIYIPDKCFDRLDVHDEYQDGTLKLQTERDRGVFLSPTLRKRFKVWRTVFPRDNSNGRDRIRNPWCYIKLSYGLNTYPEGIDKYRIELHDMMVNYFL